MGLAINRGRLMPDNTVADYGWRSAEQTGSTSYIAPALKALLTRLKIRRVADLGAGNGALCGQLAREGYDMVGIEYDQHGCEIAKSTYPQVHFHQFGVQDDPADLLRDEAPFDAVMAVEVVEHLFSPHLLPRYAGGILKSGGHLIITTPYHGYLKNLALSLCNKWDQHHTVLWHGGHIKFWSRGTLTDLLQQNGFTVTDFVGVGRVPYLWKSMILVARKN